eukprot:6214292-Pleurochrysis_carterae.AAC.2
MVSAITGRQAASPENIQSIYANTDVNLQPPLPHRSTLIPTRTTRQRQRSATWLVRSGSPVSSGAGAARAGGGRGGVPAAQGRADARARPRARARGATGKSTAAASASIRRSRQSIAGLSDTSDVNQVAGMYLILAAFWARQRAALAVPRAARRGRGPRRVGAVVRGPEGNKGAASGAR